MSADEQPGARDEVDDDGPGQDADGASSPSADDRAEQPHEPGSDGQVEQLEPGEVEGDAAHAPDLPVMEPSPGDRPDPYPGEEPLLVAEAITAGYLPGVDILTDCGLELYEGELVGIIGPNGAGKSTLVKAMFGLVDVRRGDVRLHGDVITNLPAHALVEKGVGYVPQTNNVFPSLSIRENLQMGLYLAPDRYEQMLDRVSNIFPMLAERQDTKAGGLSGGERQMVAMGRALMMDPSVLLLDEPSAGLSPDLQDETFLQTRAINAAGVSIVMVEQNARRCLQICHRGYVLDQGTDAYTGPGLQLLEDPKVIDLYLGTLAQG